MAKEKDSIKLTGRGQDVYQSCPNSGFSTYTEYVQENEETSNLLVLLDWQSSDRNPNCLNSN